MARAPLERQFGAGQYGPSLIRIGDTYPSAGLTVLASGSAAVAVSTPLVESGCLFSLATHPGTVGAAASSHGNVVVNSIVDNVSFMLGRTTAVGAPWDETVHWVIRQTN
jgi:hypothetical protein